jgi:hypothetical protein
MAPIAMAAEVKAATDLRYSQYLELATGVRIVPVPVEIGAAGAVIG